MLKLIRTNHCFLVSLISLVRKMFYAFNVLHPIFIPQFAKGRCYYIKYNVHLLLLEKDHTICNVSKTHHQKVAWKGVCTCTTMNMMYYRHTLVRSQTHIPLVSLYNGELMQLHLSFNPVIWISLKFFTWKVFCFNVVCDIFIV